MLLSPIVSYPTEDENGERTKKGDAMTKVTKHEDFHLTIPEA